MSLPERADHTDHGLIDFAHGIGNFFFPYRQGVEMIDVI